MRCLRAANPRRPLAPKSGSPPSPATPTPSRTAGRPVGPRRYILSSDRRRDDGIGRGVAPARLASSASVLGQPRRRAPRRFPEGERRRRGGGRAGDRRRRAFARARTLGVRARGGEPDERSRLARGRAGRRRLPGRVAAGAGAPRGAGPPIRFIGATERGGGPPRRAAGKNAPPPAAAAAAAKKRAPLAGVNPAYVLDERHARGVHGASHDEGSTTRRPSGEAAGSPRASPSGSSVPPPSSVLTLETILARCGATSPAECYRADVSGCALARVADEDDDAAEDEEDEEEERSRSRSRASSLSPGSVSRSSPSRRTSRTSTRAITTSGGGTSRRSRGSPRCAEYPSPRTAWGTTPTPTREETKGPAALGCSRSEEKKPPAAASSPFVRSRPSTSRTTTSATRRSPR